MSDFPYQEALLTSSPAPVSLCEIVHSRLNPSLRFANDDSPFVHDGEAFEAFRFRFLLTDREENIQFGSVIFDIVDDSLVRFIDDTGGARDARFIFRSVLRDSPDTARLTMALSPRRVIYTTQQITIQLIQLNLLTHSAIHLRFDRDTAPSLF